MVAVPDNGAAALATIGSYAPNPKDPAAMVQFARIVADTAMLLVAVPAKALPAVKTKIPAMAMTIERIFVFFKDFSLIILISSSHYSRCYGVYRHNKSNV